jgi:Rod binding domain-containing protein
MTPDALTTAAQGALSGPLRAPQHSRDAAAAKKAAEDFEAVFLNEVLGSMFEGVSTDGPFGGGPSEGIFRSMLVDRYAQAIARQGGFGIADAVQRELMRMQEAQP